MRKTQQPARLADENDYGGWEALWTDDACTGFRWTPPAATRSPPSRSFAQPPPDHHPAQPAAHGQTLRPCPAVHDAAHHLQHRDPRTHRALLTSTDTLECALTATRSCTCAAKVPIYAFGIGRSQISWSALCSSFRSRTSREANRHPACADLNHHPRLVATGPVRLTPSGSSRPLPQARRSGTWPGAEASARAASGDSYASPGHPGQRTSYPGSDFHR